MAHSATAIEECLPAKAVHTTAQTRIIEGLFVTTVFASAFLLFLVQPMIAKLVLPVLGGTPMVWNACVLFFQVTLLAGYGYAVAHRTWLSGTRRVAVHMGCVAIGLVALPLVIDPSFDPPTQMNPALWLAIALAGTVGLPFFALSTTAAVLQHWFSESDHPKAKDPYFLYVASNLGSLLALAAYPTVIEPVLRLRDQTRLWAFGYGVFFIVIALCGVVVWRSAPRAQAMFRREEERFDADSAPAPSWLLKMRWIILACVPSSLMLAITTYATTDIAAVPLSWIVPLAVYLMTFVVAFGQSGQSARALAARVVPILCITVAMLMSMGVRHPLGLVFTLHLATFAAVALYCHSDLAASRPSPVHLTTFYFCVSFGGVLGGLLNTLAAPMMFNSVLEYPIVLAAACSLLPKLWPERKERRDTVLDCVVPLVIGALTATLLTRIARDSSAAVVALALAVPAVVAFRHRGRPRRFALSVASIFVAGAIVSSSSHVLYAARTFFGVYRVASDSDRSHVSLLHGTTLHGRQAVDPGKRREPLVYYHRSGPLGQLVASVKDVKNVAVVGLGIGMGAAYAEHGQRWTFFEIDPEVEHIARSSFTYLNDCRAECRVVIGDARISLERSQEQFDLIVLDAFSSDAIPVHLLTREAMALYLRRLAPHGVLVLHISNVYLDLEPVVARLGAEYGLAMRRQFHRVNTDASGERASSRWMVMARSVEPLAALATDARWVTPEVPAPTPLWTDDFSNILSVLRVFKTGA